MDDAPVLLACHSGGRRREVTEDTEDRMRWYEAEVLLADLTGHRHTMRGACANEIEARMRQIYPTAATVLVRPEAGEGPDPCAFPAGADPDYLLLAAFPSGPPR